MPQSGLSFNTRKTLMVQLGDAAGEEIASLIQRMALRIEELERTKVNVTQIVPAEARVIPISRAA